MQVSAQDIFFHQIDRKKTEQILSKSLSGADDGELFLEYRITEGLNWDDGRIRAANHDISQGFGLRYVTGETQGYAHGSTLTEEALRLAGQSVRGVAQNGRDKLLAMGPEATNHSLYIQDNVVESVPFAAKVAVLEQIDSYARASDQDVCQVSASLMASWQAVCILRPDGQEITDIRPMVRAMINVMVSRDGKMESGSAGGGGRQSWDNWLNETVWKGLVDDAIRQARLKLDARPAPAGEMPVVLHNGWPGVLLHEAVGHGLEGDFIRKGSSAFTGRIGEQVAASGVTVVDDGVMDARRGSLNVDDEGSPTGTATLIEDGRLVGFMQDRLNSRLLNSETTGNCRRQSYAHLPMPRMTNTYMRGGAHTPQEILESVSSGVYARNFSGGQVDITNGKFVFSASEAWLIEDGKLTAPIKGMTLIGDGPTALTRIKMIGNDPELDPGIGMCGKMGQTVPVTVGQPTLRIDGLTVGGQSVG